MHPLLNIAIKAARRAGKTIMHKAYRLDQLRYDAKGARDFVTEIDIVAEKEIVEIIHEAYPNHAILAEERYSSPGLDCEWIIDPLDGTTNYIHGIPQFCVSIAVRRGRALQHAVVYNPILEELFTASRGSGAHLNDRRIRSSATRNMEEALIGTGFPFREMDNIDLWIDVFRELSKKTSGVRRPGSAALDLAYVACGRYDGFWETGLKIWDIAAGALLVQESGGLISDFLGNQDFLESGMVVAGNSVLYDELVKIIQLKHRQYISHD